MLHIYRRGIILIDVEILHEKNVYSKIYYHNNKQINYIAPW